MGTLTINKDYYKLYGKNPPKTIKLGKINGQYGDSFYWYKVVNAYFDNLPQFKYGQYDDDGYMLYVKSVTYNITDKLSKNGISLYFGFNRKNGNWQYMCQIKNITDNSVLYSFSKEVPITDPNNFDVDPQVWKDVDLSVIVPIFQGTSIYTKLTPKVQNPTDSATQQHLKDVLDNNAAQIGENIIIEYN